MDKDRLMEDVEQIVLYQVAQQVIGNLSEETRKKVLEASLTNTLDNILRPWDVQKAIENDVYKYMVEYLKHSEVQERIKNATRLRMSNFEILNSFFSCKFILHLTFPCPNTQFA